VLGIGLAVGIAIRLILLPTQGLRDDLDQFAGWVHHIATNGLGMLYTENPAGPVTFGPVMGYVWGLLAALQPAFQTVADASDTGIRMLMKTPASVADVALALLAAFALRDRPRWAVVAAVVILLHPAVAYVSAWWGQYESIFLLSGLAATVAALGGRNGLAAVLVAVSLMTKPQALPFVVPFAAWFWASGYARSGARGGVLELVRTGLIGLATIAVLWLPFIPAGGPADYLQNLGVYQNEIFNVLSLRAWNAWWLVQEAAADGAFIADDVAFLGPLTLRHVGYGVTALLEVCIALAIVRDPRPRSLALGLVASVLVVFAFMTQMHERYAYGALVFLAILVVDPRWRWVAIGFGVVFTLNLVAAIPPTPAIGSLVPVAGPLGVLGSVAMLGVTAVALAGLLRRSRSPT
jgi:Gpi18-like mannosyltransferase